MIASKSFALLMATSIVLSVMAQEPAYTLKGPPTTGSYLRHDLVLWSLPLNKTWAALTVEEQQTVRSSYEEMPEGDEPPYPANGMIELAKYYPRIQSKVLVAGLFEAIVSIDETGKARSIKIFESPDPDINKIMAAVIMTPRYKPGLCGNHPCAMDFPIMVNFEIK